MIFCYNAIFFGRKSKKRNFFKKVLTTKILCAKIYRSQKSGCGAVGSALPWGGRGRTFKSCHSDQANNICDGGVGNGAPKTCGYVRIHSATPAKYAGMAELADALDSGSSGGNFVEVQVLLPAPTQKGSPKGLPFCVATGGEPLNPAACAHATVLFK